jgi:hypothetical protein
MSGLCVTYAALATRRLGLPHFRNWNRWMELLAPVVERRLGVRQGDGPTRLARCRSGAAGQGT